MKYLLFVLSLLFISPLKAFEVAEATLKFVDDSYLLDAEVAYHLSLPALEALDNGVALTMETHFQVRADNAWIWQKDIVDFRLRARIQYLPVSSLYQVTHMASGDMENFVSRDEAIKSLGQFSGLPIVRAEQLQMDTSYRLELKSSLDIEALPLPLRPRAYISSDWSLSTGWTIWHLRR